MSLHYPPATDAQVRRFETDGFLVVEDVIAPDERAALRRMGEEMVGRPRDHARDWDWRRDEPLEGRQFRIVQSPVDRDYPWLVESRFRAWAAAFGAALMRQPMAFWYEQFLGKPPGIGAPTPWHQDEAYWGRSYANGGVTCWTAFHRVGPENGCMHFVRGAHHQVREHHRPPEMASDLLVCEVAADEEIVEVPLDEGSVTFHHSAMPHMATGNQSDEWRLALTQHFRNPACAARPKDHYPWRVIVSQRASADPPPPAPPRGTP